MSLFSGLEQFGIKADEKKVSLFQDESKIAGEQQKDSGKIEKEEAKEDQFLFQKNIRCTVCEKPFDATFVKNARIRRMAPDFDLRPRFEVIDTLKYDVLSCPHCGFSAMNRYFEHLSTRQIAQIKEKVCTHYKPTGNENMVLSYEEAIGRYKLALFCSVVKGASASEKAYTCLKISWLFRDMAATSEDEAETPETQKKKEEYRANADEFYKEAFEGFQIAIAQESFPVCGMDMHTMDFLLASMACHFHEFTKASKLVSNILLSRTADRRIKDRALDLKTIIIEEIRKDAEKSK